MAFSFEREYFAKQHLLGILQKCVKIMDFLFSIQRDWANPLWEIIKCASAECTQQVALHTWTSRNKGNWAKISFYILHERLNFFSRIGCWSITLLSFVGNRWSPRKSPNVGYSFSPRKCHIHKSHVEQIRGRWLGGFECINSCRRSYLSNRIFVLFFYRYPYRFLWITKSKI